MSKIDIDNIFFPSQQIEDPKWFAGRKQDIERALQSLCTPGASMLVFGERGAGKSSFVEMIKLLASGNSHLLFKHNFHKRFSPDKLKFKVISIECDSEIDTTAKALQRLITNPNGIKEIISSRIEKIESTCKDKFSLDLLKVIGIGTESERKVTFASFKEDSIFEIFTNLITTIHKNVLNPDEGLLIVIDEFDLVKDSSGMASLIKTLSKNNVKFLLSGIADTYDYLLKDHKSIMRQLVYGRIKINLMTDEEIIELFKIVEINTKQSIRFDPTFFTKVIEKSNRYPYFVQLFGKLSLEDYFSENGDRTPMLINGKHLKNGIKKIGLYEEQMEKDYLNIIKENPLKELIIKLVARTISNKIHEEEIFSYCYKKKIMQPHPKNNLSSLLGNRDPHFLVRENEESDYVQFSDKLFKTFVNSREPELIKISNDNDFIYPK